MYIYIKNFCHLSHTMATSKDHFYVCFVLAVALVKDEAKGLLYREWVRLKHKARRRSWLYPFALVLWNRFGFKKRGKGKDKAKRR